MKYNYAKSAKQSMLPQQIHVPLRQLDMPSLTGHDIVIVLVQKIELLVHLVQHYINIELPF